MFLNKGDEVTGNVDNYTERSINVFSIYKDMVGKLNKGG
jgi:hypothetical protein